MHIKDWQQIRKDFPAVNDYTYLDSASISLMPLPVQKKMADFSNRINYAGTVSFDEQSEIDAVTGARNNLAALLHCSPENIAVLSCSSEGLNQVAWGIQPRRKILLLDIDFPSDALPWARIARQTGAKLEFIHIKDHLSQLNTETIINRITSQTDVVCISQAQYSNGLVIDINQLAQACHEKGALCIIDSVQAAGIVPIDLSKSPVDALVVGGYKWLCGPFGAAGLYIADHLKERIEPAFVGWRSMKNPYHLDATRYEFNDGLRGYEFGTMNYAAGYAFGEAIAYILNIGIEAICQRAHQVSGYLMQRLTDLGAEVLTPQEDHRRTGTVFCRFPGLDGESVAVELNNRGVIVSPRFNGCRFACHFFNNEEDIDKAMEVLVDILQNQRHI